MILLQSHNEIEVNHQENTERRQLPTPYIHFNQAWQLEMEVS
jgi:hypothetical protein